MLGVVLVTAEVWRLVTSARGGGWAVMVGARM